MDYIADVEVDLVLFALLLPAETLDNSLTAIISIVSLIKMLQPITLHKSNSLQKTSCCSVKYEQFLNVQYQPIETLHSTLYNRSTELYLGLEQLFKPPSLLLLLCIHSDRQCAYVADFAYAVKHCLYKDMHMV